jgi:hypothetical protein
VPDDAARRKGADCAPSVAERACFVVVCGVQESGSHVRSFDTARTLLFVLKIALVETTTTARLTLTHTEPLSRAAFRGVRRGLTLGSRLAFCVFAKLVVHAKPRHASSAPPPRHCCSEPPSHAVPPEPTTGGVSASCAVAGTHIHAPRSGPPCLALTLVASGRALQPLAAGSAAGGRIASRDCSCPRRVTRLLTT